MRLEYHPNVKLELEQARDFYEQQIPGLGAKFIDEFERQVLQIAGMPKRFRIIQADTRRALMNRFPYAIYFRLVTPNLIRITLVKHQRKHPIYGMERI